MDNKKYFCMLYNTFTFLLWIILCNSTLEKEAPICLKNWIAQIFMLLGFLIKIVYLIKLLWIFI